MRLFTLLIMMLFITLLFSGCTANEPKVNESAGLDEAEYEQNVQQELNETLLTENDTVDIGDMI